MAVPKLGLGMAMYRQGRLYKDHTSNPISTSLFIHDISVSPRIKLKGGEWWFGLLE